MGVMKFDSSCDTPTNSSRVNRKVCAPPVAASSSAGAAETMGPTTGTNCATPANSPSASGAGTPSGHSPSPTSEPTSVMLTSWAMNQPLSARPQALRTSRRRGRAALGTMVSTPSRDWLGWAARNTPATSTSTRVVTPEARPRANLGARANTRPAWSVAAFSWVSTPAPIGVAERRCWAVFQARGTCSLSWLACCDTWEPNR